MLDLEIFKIILAAFNINEQSESYEGWKQDAESINVSSTICWARA